MLPVEILPVQETIVLRARGSELLILPHHVKKLKGFVKPRDFSQYFRAEALVNRPARKLFEAWLRKDHTLWPRLYQTVHKDMDVAEGDGEDGDTAGAAREVSTRTTPVATASREATTDAAAAKVAKKAAPPVVEEEEEEQADDDEDEAPAKAAKSKDKDADKNKKKDKPDSKAKSKDKEKEKDAKADKKSAKPAADKKKPAKAPKAKAKDAKADKKKAGTKKKG